MAANRRRAGIPPLTLGALYGLLTAVPIVIAAWSGEGHRFDLMRAAAATGMAAGVMLVLQAVTSGRFEAISGRIGIDVTMAFHKWAAPVALVLAILHVFFVIGPPDASLPHRFERRISAVLNDGSLADARWALALFAILVVMALLRDRLPLRYEPWRATHAIMALAVIGLLLAHILTDGRGGDLAAAFWLMLTAAVVLPTLGVYLRRLTAPEASGWAISRSRKVAERLWEIELRPSKGQSLPYRAGQFAWAAFGRHRLPFFDHPFSIASAPGEPVVRFLIQEAGDFTRTIGSLPTGTRVGLDAPHGSFGLKPDGDGAILLIAGGVGIAPILSVLGDLAASGHAGPVRMIYAGRHPGAMLGAAFWQPACDKLGVSPVLLADRDFAVAGMERGPLTDAHLRAALDGLEPATAQALVCGPGPMMTFATDTLARLGVPLHRIGYERFSYSAGSLSRKDRRMLGGFIAIWGAVALAVLAYSLI